MTLTVVWSNAHPPHALRANTSAIGDALRRVLVHEKQLGDVARVEEALAAGTLVLNPAQRASLAGALIELGKMEVALTHLRSEAETYLARSGADV